MIPLPPIQYSKVGLPIVTVPFGQSVLARFEPLPIEPKKLITTQIWKQSVNESESQLNDNRIIPEITPKKLCEKSNKDYMNAFKMFVQKERTLNYKYGVELLNQGSVQSFILVDHEMCQGDCHIIDLFS